MEFKKTKNFKIVYQKDAMQCGVACMSMICKYYGRNYSCDVLSKFLTPSPEGVSMKGISDLCETVGLNNKAGLLSIDRILKAPLPAIIHWKQNHFVVLYKVSGNKSKGPECCKFHIADPAKGKISYSFPEFQNHWGALKDSSSKTMGLAMFFNPGNDFNSINVNEESTKKGYGYLYYYLRQYKKQFSIIAFSLLVGSIIQLLLPFLTQWIVDIGIHNEDLNFVWLVLLGGLMLVIGSAAFDFIRRWVLLRISMKINISLISDFFIKLLSLPMSYFDTKLTGDLLQRMGDNTRVQSFLTSDVLGIVFTLLTYIVLSIVLMIYDYTIFLIFMGWSIIYFSWILLFMRRRKVLDYEIFEKQSTNNGVTYRLLTSMQEIKLQGCQQRRRKEWEDTQQDILDVKQKSLKLQQAQEAGGLLMNELKNILITAITAASVINGDMSLGEMLAIQYIIGQLNSPMSKIMAFIYILQDVKISLERLNEVHEAKGEKEGRESSQSTSLSSKTISLKDVCFKYDRHSLTNTLSGISLDIKEGCVTAIVGASGSGKTTLVKLLLSYFPLEQGEISIGGTPINDYDPDWWRNRCGAVMQDGIIFSESIERNIAVGDGDIDRNKLEEAAKTACIHDFILSLPLKYNTKIGQDGMGLSQGQKQRILIARAIYKNPDFIFLDEATNSLDASNEKEIVDNLSDFYIGKTVLVVAHRLSTVRNADLIVVMEKGEIVERGTHEYLIALKGYYWNLIHNQLEMGA